MVFQRAVLPLLVALILSVKGMQGAAPLPYGRPIDELLAQPIRVVLGEELRHEMSGVAILQKVAALKTHLENRAFYLLGRRITLEQRWAHKFSPTTTPGTHLLLIGLPSTHPFLLDQLSPFPIGLFQDMIRVGSRSYQGEDVSLLLRTSQADDPERELIVAAGTSTNALLFNIDGLLDLPGGSYRLLRGKAILEEGELRTMGWPREKTVWSSLQRGEFLFRVPRGVALSRPLLERRERHLQAVVGLFSGSSASGPNRPIVYQVYENESAFWSHTRSREGVFLDPVTETIHLSMETEAPEQERELLATLLLWRAWGRCYVPLLEEGLPLALLGTHKGLPLHQWAHALDVMERLPSAEELIHGSAFQLPPGDILAPARGSFVLSLLQRYGFDAVRELYRNADAKTIRARIGALSRSMRSIQKQWEMMLTATSQPNLEELRGRRRAPTDPRTDGIRAALDARDDELAKELSQDLLREQPTSGFARLSLARIALRRAAFDEALGHAELGYGAEGVRNTLAHLHLSAARALAQKGNRSRAGIELSLAQSLSDDVKLQAMIEFWLDQIEMEGKPPRVLVDQAMEQAASGRMEQAVAEIERLLGRDPLNREGHLALNYLYGRMGWDPEFGPIGVPYAMIQEAEMLYHLSETPREKIEALYALDRGWRSLVIEDIEMIERILDEGFAWELGEICTFSFRLGKNLSERWNVAKAIEEAAGSQSPVKPSESMTTRLTHCRDLAAQFRQLMCEGDYKWGIRIFGKHLVPCVLF